MSHPMRNSLLEHCIQKKKKKKKKKKKNSSKQIYYFFLLVKRGYAPKILWHIYITKSSMPLELKANYTHPRSGNSLHLVFTFYDSIPYNRPSTSKLVSRHVCSCKVPSQICCFVYNAGSNEVCLHV
jgi:hypothetical protein